MIPAGGGGAGAVDNDVALEAPPPPPAAAAACAAAAAACCCCITDCVGTNAGGCFYKCVMMNENKISENTFYIYKTCMHNCKMNGNISPDVRYSAVLFAWVVS